MHGQTVDDDPECGLSTACLHFGYTLAPVWAGRTHLVQLQYMMQLPASLHASSSGNFQFF